jgi:Tol biopolymer transport system component
MKKLNSLRKVLQFFETGHGNSGFGKSTPGSLSNLHLDRRSDPVILHARTGVVPLSAETGWGFNPHPNEANLSFRPALMVALANLSKSIKVLLLSILFLLFSAPAFGQYYFGKNKIQYTNFEWQVLTTDHFHVYFYPEEREIAEIAANYAEESYRFLENKFNHHIKKMIPLVIYSSPNYFEQTNVIPTLLPENVAGFTELFKGRMVIPFDGSYFGFRRVIRHELVHAFVMQKIPYVMKSHRRYNYTGLPLWFEEGLAEHWSREWGTEADMMMRDLVISGRFIRFEDISQVYGSYLMYKIGESFLNFLEREYGDDKIGMIFENYWKGRSFDEVFEITLGKSLKQIWGEWEYFLKKKYFPQIKDSDLPNKVSTQLTFDGINIMPEPLSLEGEGWIVFKSNKLGYSTISLMSPKGEKRKLVTLVKGERSPQFESLHLMKSKIEVCPKGKIAFVSKSNENDVLYVYDVKARKIQSKDGFTNLTGLSSPTWSPDGKKIAFIGVTKEGYSDLYSYDFQTGLLEQLTQDLYEEKDPRWSADGRYIAFSSDRGTFGKDGFLNLFLLDVSENKIQPLTLGPHHDLSCDWSPDGKGLVFSSDRNGAYNLYFLPFGFAPFGSVFDSEVAQTRGEPQGRRQGGDSSTSLTVPEQFGSLTAPSRIEGQSRRELVEPPSSQNPLEGKNSFQAIQLTDLITGAFDPSFSPDGKTIYFSAYQGYNFQIYRMAFQDSLSKTMDFSYDTSLIAPNPQRFWQPEKIGGVHQRGVAKYKKQFSFDIAQSVISYDAVYGTVGGFQTALTDMLGNHQYFFLVGNSAQSKDEFLSSFNFGLTYLNKSHRINYGLGFFHLKDEYYEEYYGYYDERQYGGFAFASYPLSKFKRVEASLFLRESDREYSPTNRRKAFLSTNYISLILDTSIWDFVGPIDGHRFNLTLGLTMNVKGSELYNKLILFDFRKYLRLKKSSCFAIRTMGFSSSGKEPQRLYLGGSWSLRGYDRRAFYGRHLVLINNELRFPLIDNLSIGFPIGRFSFQAIRGALFFDAGNAWDDDFERLFGSFGLGARVSLGGFIVLRFDVSKTTDFKKIERGSDFDFFFGWSF